MSAIPDLEPLVISAPFGNYVKPRGATPTLGTFTRRARAGRVWRILKTVRYDPFTRAWVNKIGLRNPGIEAVAARVRAGSLDVSRSVLSIHGFDDAEWFELIEIAAAIQPLGIELNMSCPNVGEIDWPPTLFDRAVASGRPVVVKLPPVNYREMLDQAMAAGVRTFHACNTIPVPAGGVSGKPLKPVAMQCVREVRDRLETIGGAFAVIGGGGITAPSDIDDYARAGATHVAVGCKCFNPVLLVSHGPLRPLLARAAAMHTDDGATP
ncbi:MAG: hypothetical protein AAGI30_11195 [Planctomycetota bacterium]